VRVCGLWDGQLLIHIVRGSTPRFTKSPSLVLIRLVLTEIRPFGNVKVNKEMFGHSDTATGRPCISLWILTFSNDCVLPTIGSIYNKLGDFVKLGLHFMTMWVNNC